MTDNRVLLDIDQRGVAWLTLNNPDKHNAFDDDIIAELITKLNDIAESGNIRVLVLKAKGKNFSAGADLAWMQRMVSLDKEANQRDAEKLALLMQTLNEIPLPTIVRVQGAAFGGAVGLIACCDIAIATDESNFALSEAKIGLAPATISPYVIAAIGARQCRRLFLTAERFWAARACEWGLIHEVTTIDKLDEQVEITISQLLGNSPTAISASKTLIQQLQNKPLGSSVIQQTSELIAKLRVSEEGQEGINAFFEKRAPYWHPDFTESLSND